jgi:hypothetical protein
MICVVVCNIYFFAVRNGALSRLQSEDCFEMAGIPITMLTVVQLVNYFVVSVVAVFTFVRKFAQN